MRCYNSLHVLQMSNNLAPPLPLSKYSNLGQQLSKTLCVHLWWYHVFVITRLTTAPRRTVDVRPGNLSAHISHLHRRIPIMHRRESRQSQYIGG